MDYFGKDDLENTGVFADEKTEEVCAVSLFFLSIVAAVCFMSLGGVQDSVVNIYEQWAAAIFGGGVAGFVFVCVVGNKTRQRVRERVQAKAKQTPLHLVSPETVFWENWDEIRLHGFREERYDRGDSHSNMYVETYLLVEIGAFGDFVVEDPKKGYRYSGNLHELEAPERTENVSLKKRREHERNSRLTEEANRVVERLASEGYREMICRARREVKESG